MVIKQQSQLFVVLLTFYALYWPVCDVLDLSRGILLSWERTERPNHTALDKTGRDYKRAPVRVVPGRVVPGQRGARGPRLHVGADAAAACEHVPHGDGARQVGFAVVCDVDRHWQVQVLLLDAAVVDPLAAVPQAIGLVVQRRLGGRGRLEVERRLVVRARRTEGLRACQFSRQGGSGEEGGAIGDGGGGGRSRHNVVVGVDGGEAGCDGEVRLLLLRLGLFFLTAIILGREEDTGFDVKTSKRSTSAPHRTIIHPLITIKTGDLNNGGSWNLVQDTDHRNRAESSDPSHCCSLV